MEMERDTEFERECLTEAASSLGLEQIGEHLHQLANRRAGEGGVALPPERDLIDEWIEEAADGVGNYGVWELRRMQQLDEEPSERIAAVWEALRYGVLMYNALLKAKQAD